MQEKIVENSSIKIDIPAITDWQEFKRIRLEALQNDPAAFGASYEKEANLSDKEWQEKLGRALGEHPGELLVIAKDNGKYIGTIGAFPKNEKLWNIKAVYVSPAYRRAGVSKKLVEEMIKRIDGMEGVETIELSVNTTAEAAVNLYKQFGFEVYDIEKGFTFGDGKQYDKYEMRRVRNKT